MKTRLGKIFLIAVLVPIFLFLSAKEANAGCTYAYQYRDLDCVPDCFRHPSKQFPAACVKCPGDQMVVYHCDNCGQCGGGGGGDTTPPVCGVEIEPSVTGGNLVVNNSFDSWTGDSLNDWTWGGPPKKLDGPFWDGLHNPRSSPSVEVYDYIQQDIPVQKGAIYFIRVWAKARYYNQEGDENWGVARFSVDDSYKVIVTEGKYSWPWTKFEGTFVAKDWTMTLALIADWAGDNSWYTEVAFDDILVKKIAGADNAPGQNVQLKIGVWDDRSINEYRIRNQGQAWEKDEDGEAIWQETVRTGNRGFEFFNQSFPWTLSNSYGVDVEVRDAYANKSETCSDTITFSAPDLIVSDFQILTAGCGSLLSGCAQPGESLCARVTVQNIGNAKAAGSFIGFRKRGGVPVETKWISFLDPGLTHTKDFDFTTPDTPVTYTAKAWADYTNIVDESNDTNNTANASYCVATPIMSPWFQTQEGDVHAQGSISSVTPDGEVFCLDGDGGTPGVVSREASLSVGDISSTDWNARTEFSRNLFDYFDELLKDESPEEIACQPCDPSQIETLPSGIYKKTGSNLRIRNTEDGKVNLGGKKIVVLVDGDLILNANIRMADESGFVAFIVNGNITVGGYSLSETGNAPDLEGVFIADGSFDLGSSSNRFIGNGIFIAGSFDMTGRDLGDDNIDTPRALFKYNPNLWLNAPDELLIPSYTWQELAP